MATEKLDLLIEGGKAAADQNTAQKLGPLGILQKVLSSVNEKTASFAGMKVPVKVSVNTSTKEFTINIGTPPVSELIKKEFDLKKGSGTPDKQKIANMSIEDAIKIAKMKESSMHVNSIKSAVKSIVGSANSLGILVEGKQAIDTCRDIANGVYDEKINSGKTETTKDKRVLLKTQLDTFNEGLKKELEKLKAEATAEEAKTEEKKEAKVEEKKEAKVEEKKEESPKEEKSTKGKEGKK